MRTRPPTTAPTPGPRRRMLQKPPHTDLGGLRSGCGPGAAQIDARELDDRDDRCGSCGPRCVLQDVYEHALAGLRRCAREVAGPVKSQPGARRGCSEAE